ncbi:hypothetical protein TSAR_015174 [Trichomalopsis sarcophagae]|uniref:Transferrin n=1 Tax=Trichomalopsis sarcophagae TaxID=543379 RepID=A0A232FF46_9HYME|nr:hypothetical protein TSAR_015174 [Trichomalopsis sarcophagae]
MASKILWTIFVFSCLQLWQNTVDAGALKFCATTKKLSRTNDALMRTCKDIQHKASEINCVIVDDRLTCLRMLVSGLVDFTVLEPEDLTILHTDVIEKSDVLITHELKTFSENQPQHDVEMIALVKNKFDNMWTTKDKRLCYIGFELGYTPTYHYHYTSYFERWIIMKQCDAKKTLLENRIADLSQHFESACIAGPWSLDSAYDGVLKSKYKNLCALCGSPVGCYEGDRFYGMQGAINCLLENVGDIAWLNRDDVKSHFAELASYGFSMLCPDGMFIPLSANKTCTWIAEPRPTIVARSDAADRVTKTVTDMGNSGKLFYPVIHASYKFSHLANMTPALTPEDYTRRCNSNFFTHHMLKENIVQVPGYSSSRVLTTCHPERTIRWCVSSNIEANKCGWMQAAAVAMDIEPRISCIQQKDRKSALEAVRDDRCDIYVAKPEEELHARSMNLTPIAHMISNKDLEASRFATIVRKDAKYKNFNDLRGAKACFSGYKSVGWNAFFSYLRNSSSSWDCEDEKAISQFFNQSCVYGLNEKNTTVPKNLYSLCNKTHFEDKLGPEENAFKCLMKGGDVAFVNVSAAKQYYSGFSIFHMNYRMLCQDESYEGAQPCFIAETTLGSVLGNKNITQVRKEEIYLMLLSLDRFFGRTYDRETAMFTLYGPFEGQSDVIFPDNTQHLQKHVADLRHGRTYEEILESLQDKVECGMSGSSSLSNSVIVIFSVVIFNALRTFST